MSDAADAGDRPARNPPAVRSVVTGLSVATVVAVLDQVTKAMAERWLEPGVFVPLLGEHIGWQLVYNPGAAFGIPAPPWLFLLVTLLVIAIVARILPRTGSLTQALALGLLLAGALGNVVDRLTRPGDPDAWVFGTGYVVDFVAWGAFPRFNVADSAITIGFVLLAFTLWRHDREDAADASRNLGEGDTPDPPRGVGEDPDRPRGIGEGHDPDPPPSSDE